ncbi:MFS transporter [Thermacetogenium phaeum]|jgi:tetrahydromethanopterin S-methyltransferase subunit F|uniref:hypothetical protein n=1 Tax=Thermacetogenium phaeum TaxID=85874 RepID=UPI00031344F3|nr:hypothetical protein [Thermacetogenium phaeum]
MSFLPSAASTATVGWRLALFGIGTGIFQSPNNSAIMGTVPRPHLDSGVLATARNTGIALGIATAGLILYSLVPPPVIAQTSLDGSQAAFFFAGLKYSYLAGAALTAFAALFSGTQSEPARKNKEA